MVVPHCRWVLGTPPFRCFLSTPHCRWVLVLLPYRESLPCRCSSCEASHCGRHLHPWGAGSSPRCSCSLPVHPDRHSRSLLVLSYEGPVTAPVRAPLRGSFLGGPKEARICIGYLCSPCRSPALSLSWPPSFCLNAIRVGLGYRPFRVRPPWFYLTAKSRPYRVDFWYYHFP